MSSIRRPEICFSRLLIFLLAPSDVSSLPTSLYDHYVARSVQRNQRCSAQQLGHCRSVSSALLSRSSQATVQSRHVDSYNCQHLVAPASVKSITLSLFDCVVVSDIQLFAPDCFNTAACRRRRLSGQQNSLVVGASPLLPERASLMHVPPSNAFQNVCSVSIFSGDPIFYHILREVYL